MDKKGKILPTNFKVIFPHKLQNLHFNPKNSKFEIHPDFINDISNNNNTFIEPEYHYQENPKLDFSIQDGGASSKEELVRDLKERDDIEIISQLNENVDSLENDELDLDINDNSDINEDILEIIENDKERIEEKIHQI